MLDQNEGVARTQYIYITNLKHKLLSPIQAIVEYSEILMDDLASQDFTSDLQAINDAGEHLFTYVRKILDQAGNSNDTDINEFGARVKHELRTHLNHIIGYSEILIEEAEESEKMTFAKEVEKIHLSSRHLLSHMDDILDFSQIESGDVEPWMVNDNNNDIQLLVNSIKPLSNDDRASSITGFILVVDDNEMNRDLLVTRLKKNGHKVNVALNGQEAIQKLNEKNFDLLILDIMMPIMNGYEVLKHIKADEKLKAIPVIMFSALDEIDSLVRCLEMGAEDYLVKPVKPIILKAHVSASLEKKQLRDREQMYYLALQQKQNELSAELNEAAEYVKSLLPETNRYGNIATQWKYVPSSQLGGDSFSYHWLDDDHFAIYLLDVCGHGVGSALLSVSIMNVLKSKSLPDTDFYNPTDVMLKLNSTFRMEDQNGKYFSIWYGVYNKQDKTLNYTCCGHPPAILVNMESSEIQQLGIGGAAIIGFPEMDFPSDCITIDKPSKLYVFSDGIYEIEVKSGDVLGFDDFVDAISQVVKGKDSSVNNLVDHMTKLNNDHHFADDISLLEVIIE